MLEREMTETYRANLARLKKAIESGRVDHNDPDRNLYGCYPCPECGGVHRAAYGDGRLRGLVECADCGYLEPATFSDVPIGPKPSWPAEDPQVDGKTAVIINYRGEYFGGYRAAFTPRYDGDDHCTIIEYWTRDPSSAIVYDNPASAKRTLRRLQTGHVDSMAIVS